MCEEVKSRSRACTTSSCPAHIPEHLFLRNLTVCVAISRQLSGLRDDEEKCAYTKVQGFNFEHAPFSNFVTHNEMLPKSEMFFSYEYYPTNCIANLMCLA